EGRDLPLRAGSRRRGCCHHGRQGAARGAARTLHRPRRRHADPALDVPKSSPVSPSDFAQVETWVFDLDNTLYPHDLNLWQQIDDRIRAYVSDFLKVSPDEAFRVQKDYYKRYGTTMRGLMAEHGMKPDDFLEFVHEIDHSPLLPNPALGDALEKLP